MERNLAGRAFPLNSEHKRLGVNGDEATRGARERGGRKWKSRRRDERLADLTWPKETPPVSNKQEGEVESVGNATNLEV